MDLQQVLYAALHSEVGYEIQTPEPTTLRTKLYRERQSAQRSGNHDFDKLSFFEMNDGQSLWIVKHSALRYYRGDEDAS